VIWIWIYQLYNIAFLPELGTDSFSYHLTFPAYWFKTHSLYTPLIPFNSLAYPYYPLNGEFFIFWLLCPFQDDTLARFAQLPFLAGLGLVCYSILRKLDLSRKRAYLVSLLVLVLPPFVRETYLAYNDIIVAFLFLSVINQILILKQGRKFSFLFLALNVGLFLGTKYATLVYTWTLLIVFLGYLLEPISQRQTSDFSSGRLLPKLSYYIITTIFSLTIVMLSGGFSYVRNFAATSNPFYPLSLSIGNLRLFQGVFESSMIKEATPWSKILNVPFGQYEFSLPSQAVWIFLVCFLSSIVHTLRKQRYRLDKTRWAILLALPLVLLQYSRIIPSYDSRHLFPFYALLVLIIGLSLNVRKKYSEILIILLILASCQFAFPWEAKIKSLLVALIISILIFIAHCAVKIRPYLAKYLLKIGLPLFSLGLISFGIWFWFELDEKYWAAKYHAYSQVYPDFAKSWFWLEKQTMGKGEVGNIAYTGHSFAWPLFGHRLQNNVYYVSVNQRNEVMIHDYKVYNLKEPPGNNLYFVYRSHPNKSIWMDNLRRKSIDYLFIYGGFASTPWPIEYTWAEETPQIFKEACRSPGAVIFEVSRSLDRE